MALATRSRRSTLLREKQSVEPMGNSWKNGGRTGLDSFRQKIALKFNTGVSTIGTYVVKVVICLQCLSIKIKASYFWRFLLRIVRKLALKKLCHS